MKFKATTAIEGGASPTETNFWRLRLEYDDEDSGLTEIADEAMTSNSIKACVIPGKGSILCLQEDQVRWLHEQLGRLVVALDEDGPNRPREPE
jgi:hypothetical protein